MGATTPSSLNSRTRGLEEPWSAARAGSKQKTEHDHKPQKRKKDVTNSNRLGQEELFLLWNRSLIALLLLVFSQVALNSANVRAVVWLPYSLAPASEPSPLPLARDPASSARDRSSPASSEPRRNPLSPVTPVIPSPHHPFCRGAVQFRRARGAPQYCWDRQQAQRGIPSPRRQGFQRRALAGRAEGVSRRRQPRNRWLPRSRTAGQVQSPRAHLLHRVRF